jgi:predicted AAA+ superfamily ATPase
MDERTKMFVLGNIADTPRVIDEELREINTKRFFVNELKEAISKSGQRIFLLVGLRGTGKTTALYQIFSSLEREEVAYFSCDEMVSRRIELEDLLSALDYIKKEKIGMEKRFVLLLDEIAYLPEWDLKLKVLRDKRPNLIIIAASSSALPLKKTLELARRSSEIQVLPLSFREYLSLKYGINIPDELAKDIRKKLGKENLEAEYLKVLSLIGNYNLFALYEEYVKQDLPFALKLNEIAYKESVNKIVKRTVYEDLSKYEKMETKMLGAAEVLIKYLSTIPADGVKITTLSQVSGISKESVSKLLDVLELAMLVKGVEYKGRGRMFKKPKKWFFYSSSMRYILASPVAGRAESVGNLREDSVFRHLAQISDNIFYDHEADFIVDGMKFEVGKGKPERKDVIILGMEERIEKNRIPLPLALLAV